MLAPPMGLRLDPRCHLRSRRSSIQLPTGGSAGTRVSDVLQETSVSDDSPVRPASPPPPLYTLSQLPRGPLTPPEGVLTPPLTDTP